MNKTTNLQLNLPDPNDFYNVEDSNQNMEILDEEVNKRVVKEAGKGLSTNDFTNGAKAKVDNLPDNTNRELENKLNKADEKTKLSDLEGDATHRLVTDTEKNKWSGKANKPTTAIATMSASGWSNGTYSFENTYPVSTYDIEIALDSTATSGQVEAFNGALIVGSATSNIVKAYGIVPTVDIPIVIKVVKK